MGMLIKAEIPKCMEKRKADVKDLKDESIIVEESIRVIIGGSWVMLKNPMH